MFVISFFAFVKQMQAGCYEMYHFASHKPVSLYRACSSASKSNCRPVKTRLLDRQFSFPLLQSDRLIVRDSDFRWLSERIIATFFCFFTV